jgi:ubiquinone/menaquinone biosynthesis C-methylase UbiE
MTPSRVGESASPLARSAAATSSAKSGVLDLASGTGEPALGAAQRVGASGSVLGLDFVEEMLDFAREKALARGLTNVEFRCGDAECLESPTPFDAALIRFGLMFLPSPDAALARVRGVLKPGARIALACWAGPEANAWAALPMKVLRRHVDVPAPPPGATGLFAFADKARLAATLERASFADVRCTAVELTMADFASAAEYWAFTRELAGPIAAIYAGLDPSARAAVDAEIEEEAQRASRAKGRVVLSGCAWVASGCA